MRRLRRGIPVGLAAALALAACAPPRALLMPAPPEEIRRETDVPRPAVRAEDATPGLPGKAPGPEATAERGQEARATTAVQVFPERLTQYIMAYGDTQRSIASGAPLDAVPSWKALEDSKWGTDAVYNQGVLFQLAGDLDEAAAQYRRAVERSPDFAPPLANLLGIALLRGDGGQMKSLLARVVPPGSAPAPGTPPELTVNAAAALMEARRREEASLLLGSLRERGKATPALPWNEAVLAFRGGDRAKARRLADSVPPTVATLFPVVASRFAWAGQDEKVPDLGPVPPGMSLMEALRLNLAAYAAYRSGSATAAETVLAVAVAREPAAAELLTNFGIVQAEQGRWDAARTFLERAVRENPELAAAWLNLGIFRELYEGNRSGALECYDSYVKLNGWRTEEVRRWSERLGRSGSPRE